MDTELSYIYPKILKGIIQEIQKRRINQKNKNIITKPETLPITTIKENESTSSHDNNKIRSITIYQLKKLILRQKTSKHNPKTLRRMKIKKHQKYQHLPPDSGGFHSNH